MLNDFSRLFFRFSVIVVGVLILDVRVRSLFIFLNSKNSVIRTFVDLLLLLLVPIKGSQPSI